MKTIILLTTVLMLSGCAGTSTREAISIAVNQCPSLKKYTKEQMLLAVKELNTLPSGNQLSMILNDYSRLRDACRIAERKIKAIKLRQKPATK